MSPFNFINKQSHEHRDVPHSPINHDLPIHGYIHDMFIMKVLHGRGHISSQVPTTPDSRLPSVKQYPQSINNVCTKNLPYYSIIIWRPILMPIYFFPFDLREGFCIFFQLLPNFMLLLHTVSPKCTCLRLWAMGLVTFVNQTNLGSTRNYTALIFKPLLSLHCSHSMHV